MPDDQSSKTALYWFRRDLRLSDNPGLTKACSRGLPVVPVFIIDPIVEAMGAAARWRLGLSLAHLDAELRAVGSRLIVRKGASLQILQDLAQETNAATLDYGRDYTEEAIARDTDIKSEMGKAGLDVESHNALLLFEPWTVKTQTGGYFKVYSPMWRAVRDRDVPNPVPAPENIASPDVWPDGLDVASLDLGRDMYRGAEVVAKHVRVGEARALARLDDFIANSVEGYKSDRNNLDQVATSGLSENLTYGEISPRQMWHAGWAAMEAGASGAEHFLKEIVWREFSYHLLFHTPHIAQSNWREGWDDFPWRADNKDAQAWRRGETGEPVVDAAMREMYVTGQMHNRARMIVASYLTKHLMVHWHVGMEWFAECLTDWDPASNALGWQWVAGCGPDAAPFFRIFNPAVQAEKFDINETYRRHYLEGEGADAFLQAIPKSWTIARPDVPIVNLKEGRERALAAYSALADAKKKLQAAE